MHIHQWIVIPPDKHGIDNTTGSGVYSSANNLRIVERLPCLQNILRAELNAILIAIQGTQHHTQDTHIFTNSLDTICLIHNHIRHPSSQHNYLDKLLITAIVNHITWSIHKIAIQKVTTHTSIIGSEIVDQLANNGALRDKPMDTTQIHTVHTTPTGLMESQQVHTQVLYATCKHTSTKDIGTKN